MGLTWSTPSKEGPEYYAHLFTDAGVQPEGALVVDDSADALRWASQLGAGTVLVGASPHPETGTIPRLAHALRNELIASKLCGVERPHKPS